MRNCFDIPFNFAIVQSPQRTGANEMKKHNRAYSANAGKGSRGKLETIRVSASTPSEVFTILQRMGYTRISGITAI
jgi:hypothetical protein